MAEGGLASPNRSREYLVCNALFSKCFQSIISDISLDSAEDIQTFAHLHENDPHFALPQALADYHFIPFLVSLIDPSTPDRVLAYCLQLVNLFSQGFCGLIDLLLENGITQSLPNLFSVPHKFISSQIASIFTELVTNRPSISAHLSEVFFEQAIEWASSHPSFQCRWVSMQFL
jgi:hypothetical protein